MLWLALILLLLPIWFVARVASGNSGVTQRIGTSINGSFGSRCSPTALPPSCRRRQRTAPITEKKDVETE